MGKATIYPKYDATMHAYVDGRGRVRTRCYVNGRRADGWRGWCNFLLRRIPARMGPLQSRGALADALPTFAHTPGLSGEKKEGP